MSGFKAIAFGPFFYWLIHRKGYELANARQRYWIYAELAMMAAWVTLAMLWAGGHARLGPLSVLDWTCVVVIIGCVQTIWVRLARIMRA